MSEVNGHSGFRVSLIADIIHHKIGESTGKEAPRCGNWACIEVSVGAGCSSIRVELLGVCCRL